MTRFSCGCDVCTHAPTTVRRLRCRREQQHGDEPDLHTPSHVDYEVKLLPAETPVVVYETRAAVKQPELRRLGVELPWIALFAICCVLYAHYFPPIPPNMRQQACVQPCSR